MYTLDSRHFTLDHNILKTAIPGYSVVLFHSSTCPHCHTIMPKFIELSTTSICRPNTGKFNPIRTVIGNPPPRISFALLQTDANGKVVEMANKSNTPMPGVPMVVLYKDGIPVDVYKGKHEMRDMENWLVGHACGGI